MLLPDQNIVAISIIFRKFNIWNNDRCAHLGLTAAQVPVIAVVCETGGISQNELVERVCLEKSVVAKSVAKLMEAGYITRQQSKTDHRAYDLFPTDHALAIYPEVVEISRACMDHLAEGMSEEEKAAFCRLLQKVRDNALKLNASER